MAVSLSILMPALNEAANIESALRGVLAAADAAAIEVEVLVLTCVDRDGASDGTIDIVRRFAAADPRVRSVHTDGFQPLGEKLQQGVALASKTFVVMVPGDNEIRPESFAEVLRRVGEADILLCHPANPEVRALHRRLLSRAYTTFVNMLFGEHVKYYNGTNVYRTADLQSFALRAGSFATGAEMVLRLVRAGRTTADVPVTLQPRLGRSKALRLDNALRVLADLLRLRLTIDREPDSRPPVRVPEPPAK